MLHTSSFVSIFGCFLLIQTDQSQISWTMRYNGIIFSNLCEPTERQMTLICNSLSLSPIPNMSEIYWEVRKSICLSKWNGTFQSNWPNQSKWTTYTGGPKHSICTKSKWMFPFDFWPKFLELLVKWNAPIRGTHLTIKLLWLVHVKLYTQTYRYITSMLVRIFWYS